MPDEKQENQPLDEDILQCKADIRDAIGANPGQSVTDHSANEHVSANDTKSEDEIFPESELTDSDLILDDILSPDSDPKEKPAVSAPVHIPSFDSMYKGSRSKVSATNTDPTQDVVKKTDTSAVGETSNKSNTEQSITTLKNADVESQHKRQEQLQKLEKEIQEKTDTLSLQSQRLEFLEKQLQNAAVLERMKFQLQQSIKDLNNKNQQLEKKSQKADEENLYLTNEIEKLKKQLQNINPVGDEIQQLQKELDGKAAQLEDTRKNSIQLQASLEQVRQEYQAAQTQTAAEFQALTEKIIFLKNEKSSLSSENAHLKNDLDDLRKNSSKIQSLQKELEQAHTVISQEKTQKQELENTIKALEDSLAIPHAENRKLSEELAEKKDKLQQLTLKHNQLQDEYERSGNQKNSELETIRGQLDLLQMDIEQAHHEYEALQTQTSGEIQALTEKTTLLQNEKQNLVVEITQLKDQLADSHETDVQAQQLRNELHSLELTLSHERAHVRDLEGTMKSLENELTDVNHGKQNLSEALTEKEQELQQQQQKIEQLQNEYERFRHQEDRELENLTFQLKNSKSDIHQLQTDIEQSRHKYDDLQTQTSKDVQELTEKTNLLQSEKQTLSDEIAYLKEEQQKAKEISEKLQCIEVDFKNVHKELINERENSENLRNEHEQVKSVLAQTQQEKEKLSSQLQGLQSTEEQLRNEIAALQKAVEGKGFSEEKLATAQDEIERLNAQNEQLQSQISDMESAEVSPQEAVKIPEKIISEPTDNLTEENSGIPVFNLAEQIMEEHRRSVSQRRQRIESDSNATHENSIKNVLEQYVHSANPVPVAEDRKSNIEHHPWVGQSLSPFQQKILEEIVRKDMELYSHKYFSSTKSSSMNN